MGLPNVYRYFKECSICGKPIRWWQVKGSAMDDIVKREVVNGVEIVYWQNYHATCAEQRVSEGEQTK